MARINPRWELAARIAEEMGNATDSNIKRTLKEMKTVESEGIDLEDAIECWRWLREREDFPIDQARLITVLKGSPTYIDQWEKSVFDNMPPVWETYQHDMFVLRYALFLKKRGWKYQWSTWESQFDGSRITYQRAKELGLAE